MDFDKLSLKEQLELAILKIECYISECNSIIEYSQKCMKDAEKRELEDKRKRDNFSLWGMSAATHSDNIRVFEKRVSEYKEEIYKYKDQLYNLKENE